MWQTEYFHVVESHQAIVEWFRGTGLRPYLSALEDEEQRKRFEELLTEKYKQVYYPQTDGRILFPFRRLFIVAYKDENPGT
jgi:trans-aconitate 2-methyltransferase